MEMLSEVGETIAVKIKTLALAEKANDRILSRGKENELINQQEFIEKHLGKINNLKNQ